MGSAPVSYAPAYGAYYLSVQGPCLGASSHFQVRPYLPSDQRKGPAYDSHGLVERSCAGGPRLAPLRPGFVAWSKLGDGVRRSTGLQRVLWRLRIHALVHALAPQTPRGTIRDFLPPQWPPLAASSLHEQEFQCRPALGGFVPGYVVAALQSSIQA